MSDIKLKPCPFCGRIDKLIISEISHKIGDTKIKQYTVVCNASGDNTGCGASCGLGNFTEQEAIEAWNRRESPKEYDLLSFEENKQLRRKIERAFNKLTPTKVEHTATIYKCCTCPSCRNVVDKIEKDRHGEEHRIFSKFCSYCGQALDWSDEQ